VILFFFWFCFLCFLYVDLLNQQGITNKEHLNIYLQLIKHASPFTYLDCLLKTTEKEMLNNLAESDDVANILYQALTESWHHKEKKTLALILKVEIKNEK
jgi:hypothetical protein